VVEAAGLIGTRVTAVGAGECGARQQLVRLRGARVRPAEPLDPLRVSNLPVISGSGLAPDRGDFEWIDDAEVEAFLSMLRE
jgi:hypothetical protein